MAAPAEDDAEGGSSAFWVRGRLNLRYDFRTTTGADAQDDHDLTQDLFAEGGKGPLRFEASGRLREDVDGKKRGGIFRDLYNTYDDAVVGFLYTAYGEVLDQGVIERIRAGRQYYAEGVDVRFDGALLESKAIADALKLLAYGGSPVHLYEASRRGDWLAGAAAEVVVIPRTTIRAELAHLVDERGDLEDAERLDGFPRNARRHDTLYALSATHRLTEEVHLYARASTFDGRSSRVEGDVYYASRDLDLSARARYIGQFGAYRNLAIEFEPYADVIGDYEPYHEGYLDVRKGLLEHLTVGAGGAIRELADDADEGPFNHELRRLFAVAEVTDLPLEGFTASVTGDWYTSDQGHRSFQLSGDVSQALGDLTIAAGTSYSLFRFDEFYLEERERVRTYYGNLEWRATKWLRARLAYSFERDDEEEYHVVRCDVRVTF
jgi:hypothetical protein